MAMTSGVRMNGFDAGAWAGWPATESFWLRMAPHALDAGDQITGLAPLVASSGQPSASSCMASPEDFRSTRTNEQPPSLAALDPLNRRARSVNSSTFSGDEATSTVVQPLGADWLLPPEELVQAVARSRSARTVVAVRLMGAGPGARRGSRATAG